MNPRRRVIKSTEGGTPSSFSFLPLPFMEAKHEERKEGGAVFKAGGRVISDQTETLKLTAIRSLHLWPQDTERNDVSSLKKKKKD